MPLPLMMLSTVGTSLLTNALPPDQRRRVINLANATDADIADDDRTFLDEAAALAQSQLAVADRAAGKSLSAEVNGILTYEDEADEPQRIHHILFATDTYAGQRAADVLHEWLTSRGQGGEVFVASGLRTNSLATFREALAKAVPAIILRIDDFRSSRYEVVFNLTGGFKGVQGFMQTLATLKSVESIYVFESGAELMRIPRLPIGPAERDIISRNFALFRKMPGGETVPESAVRAAGIPETLLFIMGGEAELSEWGATLWSDVWAEAASAALLSPADPHIVFTTHFERDADGLPRNRLRQVNDAITSLGQWLDRADRYRGRHKIRKLAAPRRAATHELYAWSDQDAGRIFFHLDGGKAVIDEVTPHLP